MSLQDNDSGVGTLSSAMESEAPTVYLRIVIPDLNLEKALQFKGDDLVWTVKSKLLSSSGQDLKDKLNYGLYMPPANGRAGKFLDEERPLQDYPLMSPFGQLEFKYKKRLYKDIQLDQKKLRHLHSKANLKLFMSAVKMNDTEKIDNWTGKGFDPNFQDADTGETPMTLASGLLTKSKTMLMLLYAGGAFLDYRNRNGMTPMHKAAEKGNYESLKTLLDLGASTNYKDSSGLTPLYLCILNSTDTNCAQLLLHDHAMVDTIDPSGWTETHQACKLGKSNHLDQLLYYGADINAQNGNGNTPLHICALNNQMSCARILLFRGADKTIQNSTSQDAFYAAILAGNKEIADLIKNYSTKDVVLYQEAPKYNEKRRGTLTTFRKLNRIRQIPSVRTVFSSLPESATDTNLASRYSDNNVTVPRTIVLHRGAAGFGFVLRGIKSNAGDAKLPISSFVPTPQQPAIQFFEKVDPGSVADKAGIKAGDFVLEINGEDVRTVSHEYAVKLIKETRDSLTLKVVAPTHPKLTAAHMDGTQTLPMKRAAPHPPMRNSNTTLSPSTGAMMHASMDGLMELDKLDRDLSHQEPVYAPIIKVPPAPRSSTNIDNSNFKTASIGHRLGKSLAGSLLEENFESIGKEDSVSTFTGRSSGQSSFLPSKRAESVPDLSASMNGRSSIVTINLSSDDSSNRYREDPYTPPKISTNDSTLLRSTSVSNTASAKVPFYVQVAMGKANEPEATIDPPIDYAPPLSSATLNSKRDTSLDYENNNYYSTGASYKYSGKLNTEKPRTSAVSQPVQSRNPPSMSNSFMFPAQSSTSNLDLRQQPTSIHNDEDRMYDPPPPPPPPPPPLSLSTQQLAQQSKLNSQSNGYSSANNTMRPAEVQRQLDENKKQESAHAALMAAITRRRKDFDPDSTENKAVPPSLGKKTYSGSKLVENRVENNRTLTLSASSSELSNENEDLLIMAEKRRREYLQKTGRMPVNTESTYLEGPMSDELSKSQYKSTSNALKAAPLSPTTSALPPSHSVTLPEMKSQNASNSQSKLGNSTLQSNNFENSKKLSSSGVADLASIVARRATERRENYENITDASGNPKNQLFGAKIVYSASPNKNSISSNGRANNTSAHSVSTPLLPPPPEFHTSSALKNKPASLPINASNDRPSVSKASTSVVYKAAVPAVDSHKVSDDMPPPPAAFADVPTQNGINGKSSPAKNVVYDSANGAGGSFENKPVAKWTVKDVCSWLDSQHLFELSEIFVKNQITGQQLVSLGRDDLVRMGIKQAGQRMTLECAIKRIASE